MKARHAENNVAQGTYEDLAPEPADETETCANDTPSHKFPGALATLILNGIIHGKELYGDRTTPSGSELEVGSRQVGARPLAVRWYMKPEAREIKSRRLTSKQISYDSSLFGGKEDVAL
jgi:hypothetical protein